MEPILENIIGPVAGGIFVATYACPELEPGSYRGYAKLCTTRPDGYFEAPAFLKVAASASSRSPEDAIALAQESAIGHFGSIALETSPAPLTW